MTGNEREYESAVMMSSVKPSAKYPCSTSPLMLVNGRTATESRLSTGSRAKGAGAASKVGT